VIIAGPPQPTRSPQVTAADEVLGTYRVQTVRTNWLEWTLVLGQRHLLRLLRGYVGHSN
jgi:hypothetical protein